MPGLALETVTGVAGLLDVAGVVVSRRCSRKVAKHEAVRILAFSKLNTVHSHMSKALEDCKISDDEYKLVFEEVEKYHAMKEELRRKHTADSLIDEKTKNELIKRRRDQARASFIKKANIKCGFRVSFFLSCPHGSHPPSPASPSAPPPYLV